MCVAAAKVQQQSPARSRASQLSATLAHRCPLPPHTMQAYDLLNMRVVAAKVHQLSPAWSEAKKASYVKHAIREVNIQKVRCCQQGIPKLHTGAGTHTILHVWLHRGNAVHRLVCERVSSSSSGVSTFGGETVPYPLPDPEQPPLCLLIPVRIFPASTSPAHPPTSRSLHAADDAPLGNGGCWGPLLELSNFPFLLTCTPPTSCSLHAADDAPPARGGAGGRAGDQQRELCHGAGVLRGRGPGHAAEGPRGEWWWLWMDG